MRLSWRGIGQDNTILRFFSKDITAGIDSIDLTRVATGERIDTGYIQVIGKYIKIIGFSWVLFSLARQEDILVSSERISPKSTSCLNLSSIDFRNPAIARKWKNVVSVEKSNETSTFKLSQRNTLHPSWSWNAENDASCVKDNSRKTEV